MTLLLTDEQREFGDTLRAFVERELPIERVREVHETESRLDERAWSGLVEMGVPALTIPEEFDGLGMGLTEASLVMESLGRSLAPVPAYTALVAAEAVKATGDQALSAELLPALAAGETTVALVALPVGAFDGAVVNGIAQPVLEGSTADRLLVTVGEGADGILLLVDAHGSGVQAEPLGALDRSQRAARITLADAPATRVEVADIAAYLDRVDAVAALLLASQQYGAYVRALEISADYARTRVQFGRSIGSFQGIKHMLADWATEAELAYALLRTATALADTGDPGFRAAALTAQVKMQGVAFQGGSALVRIHGGIGFTWEHDAHLYMKAAKASQVLLGTPGQRKERLAEALGI